MVDMKESGGAEERRSRGAEERRSRGAEERRSGGAVLSSFSPKSLHPHTLHPTPHTLVIAPHPDDETLGCGGAIALLRQMNLPVKVAIVSDGTKSHPNSKKYPSSSLRDLREKESLAALKILGVDPKDITFFRLPDGNVPNLGEAEFDKAIDLFQSYLKNIFEIGFSPITVGANGNSPLQQPTPDTQHPTPNTRTQHPKPDTLPYSLQIFLPWRNDPHRDHRASWQLVNAAIQNLKISPRLLEYPIWSWERKQTSDLLDSAKVWQLDISSVLDLKKQAIAQYRSQISDLIDDDPKGFRLTPKVLKHFTHPYEIFLEVEL
jgi:LmbE family N-acetylglucosaminyl deacetylase